MKSKFKLPLWSEFLSHLCGLYWEVFFFRRIIIGKFYDKIVSEEFQLTLQGSEKTKNNQYQHGGYKTRVNKLLDTRYVSKYSKEMRAGNKHLP